MKPTIEHMSAAQFRAMHGAVPVQPKAGNHIRLPKPLKMTKTETECLRILSIEFPACRIEFQPMRLRLPSGCYYKPDFGVFMEGGGLLFMLLVEVKGAYRLGSAGRSALAFKSAIAAFPEFKFRHATKTAEGWDTLDSPGPAAANNPARAAAKPV